MFGFKTRLLNGDNYNWLIDYDSKTKLAVWFYKILIKLI